MSWRGVYHPPHSATKLNAELTLGDRHVHVTTEQGEHVWSLADMDVSVPVGSLPLVLTFPERDTFIPDESQSLADALGPYRKGKRLHWLEQHKLAILASLLVVVLLVVLLFSHGLPALSRGLVPLVPDEVPNQIGQKTRDALDEHMLLPTQLSEQTQDRVQQQFDGLVEQLPALPLKPSLVFRQWEGTANALALSDGTIIVTDALVALADTPEQLDSILLHEIGHLAHQHSLKSLIRATLLSTTVALLTGESTGLADNLLGGGVFLLTKGYSRDDEREADAYARQHMTTIYGDATAMKAMLKRIGKSNSSGEQLEWLSTHPGMKARIEAIQSAR
ncbi:M48 family metallopeptidase [Salinivibrio sp. ES.052]|uniref:M48 family metallopeptidase n=1 Tax=Salinivibrio sp. ES.052 TaxID=1882823 RepID=UPI000927D799|nr:M48 family metallopeptidase [Salinivibrio sp. ES.052]SIO06406.1 Peptidase family M48 [Salinivibrio sp. ES.052]